MLHSGENDEEGELPLRFTDSLGQNIPKLFVVLSATRAEVATFGALSPSEQSLMTTLVNRDPLGGDMGFVILADTCGAAPEPERKETGQEAAGTFAPFLRVMEVAG